MSITVITPTLPERGHMLAEAIASVQAQTLQPDAHLVAVDYHRRGPGPLLNQLTRAADTEWLSILADDDLYDPDHLESLSDIAGLDADIVFSWGRIEGDPGRHEAQWRGDYRHKDFLAKEDSGLRGCFMFKKELWETVGGWRDEIAEDWCFLARMITAGAYVRALYRETWTYRFHGGNVSYDYQRLADGGEAVGYLARFQ